MARSRSSSLFSGTIFVKSERGFSVQQVPWDCEYRYDMPVAVWRDLIAQHYPNTGWVRLSHETIAALAAYKSAQGLLDLDHAVISLLDTDRETAQMTSNWDRARAVADAVLYEGYLLYPYRGTSSKNQSRWQFGVLGPPGAADAGLGEDDTLAAQFLVDGAQAITLVVRFLQLQHRRAEREFAHGEFEPVDELTTPAGSWLTWDEAVECEMSFGPLAFDDQPCTLPVVADAATDIELPRRRSPGPRTAGGAWRTDGRPASRTATCAGSRYGSATSATL